MKQMIAIFSLAAVGAASVQTAAAGDREWATAGKVLTGLVAAHTLARVLEPAPVYQTTTYYAQPPVYVQTQPVYVQQPVTQPAPQIANAPTVGAAPAVVYQQPVYVQTQPVYVQTQPVYFQPAPIYDAPAPCYYRPPVVSFSFGFGHGGYYHRPFHHGRW